MLVCCRQVHQSDLEDNVRLSVDMSRSRGRDWVRHTNGTRTLVIPFAAVVPDPKAPTAAHVGPGTYAAGTAPEVVTAFGPHAAAPAFDFKRRTGRRDAVGPHGQRPEAAVETGAGVSRLMRAA